MPEPRDKRAAHRSIMPPAAEPASRRDKRKPFPWDEDARRGPCSLAEPATGSPVDSRSLWHQQKMESLGLMAGGVAHEFNNCLLAIQGNTDLLENFVVAEAGFEAPRLLTEIRHAVTRAGELCTQLQTYAGRGRRTIEPVDVSALLRGMTRVLKVAVPGRHVLELDLAAKLPPVAVDPDQFRQVVMNLVVNAAEAMGERAGTITLRTNTRPAAAAAGDHQVLTPRATSAEYVCVSVADTGPGMDPVTLARVFDPFYSTRPRRRGLGLASVLGIVRSHGGGLAVETAAGRGATVSVLLTPAGPAAAVGEADAGSATDSAPGRRPLRGATVLVVEDEEYLRVLAARMLTRMGHRIHLAVDGEQALGCVRRLGDALDCILLDLVMPGMDGAECLAELRRLAPDVPVLLTSGYHEREVAHRFAGLGLAGYLQKPYAVDDLERKLAEVIGPPDPA